MQLKAEILDEKAIGRAITRITYEILEKNKGAQNLALIGIFTRGASLAQRIAKKIEEVEGVQNFPVGVLDIYKFRDDLPEREKQASKIDRTHIPFDINGKKVVLIDDVLYTGRSIRAALDALMQLGRPLCVQLGALVDRGHREIPIRADFVGKNLPTSKGEKVKVSVMEVDGQDKVSIFE